MIAIKLVVYRSRI